MMLRRRPLARKTPLKARTSSRTPTSAERLWKTPRYGRCALCGHLSPVPLHGHHIIARQVLARLGAPQWDERNRLNMCAGCHLTSHYGQENRKIPMAKIPREAIEWAITTLGEDIAVTYMDRHYAKDSE